MNIRLVRLDELDAVAAIGLGFYEEGRLPGSMISSCFVASWSAFLSSGVGVIYGMYEEEVLCGVVGGLKYPDPNDGDLVVSECFWFVVKEKRGRGIELLDAFERWAKEEGAKRIIMVHLSGLMPERIKLLYERRGYKEIEVHYVKET